MLYDRESTVSDCDLDVVGIGALNLDYIVNADDLAERNAKAALTKRIADVIEDVFAEVPWGTEMSVDGQTIYAALEAAGSDSVEPSLGGSAFNAIHTMAKTGLDLRLGYVGVAGHVPLRGMSNLGALSQLRVDHRHVQEVNDHLSGVCFSYVEEGERTLLTHAGANTRMADHLRTAFVDLVEYLGRSRILHVTSFLDDETADVLLELLQAVKAGKDGILVSFDPGHVWCTHRTEAIEGIISLTDYLLLNLGEFRAFATGGAHESDGDIARTLLDRFENPAGAVLVKTAGGIRLFTRGETGVEDEFFAQEPLAPSEIADSTGAGDVFAAGLLAFMASEELKIELGAKFGMHLAKHKLRYGGTRQHAELPEVTKGFIRSLKAGKHDPTTGKRIFVSHGGAPDWLGVKQFVRDHFGLEPVSFESHEWGSRQVTEALENALDRCCLAICVMTGEDMDRSGRRMPRQNVTHEVGLFHGRYGLDGVIAVVEEGCEFVQDLPSAQVYTYAPKRIDASYWWLRRELRRRGFEEV